MFFVRADLLPLSLSLAPSSLSLCSSLQVSVIHFISIIIIIITIVLFRFSDFCVIFSRTKTLAADGQHPGSSDFPPAHPAGTARPEVIGSPRRDSSASEARSGRGFQAVSALVRPTIIRIQKNVFSISTPPTKKTTSFLFKNKVLSIQYLSMTKIHI